MKHGDTRKPASEQRGGGPTRVVLSAVMRTVRSYSGNRIVRERVEWDCLLECGHTSVRDKRGDSKRIAPSWLRCSSCGPEAK